MNTGYPISIASFDEEHKSLWKSWKVWVPVVLLTTTGFGIALAYALTNDRTPPQIQGLAWEPTRIVNDKIYDIAVEFNASDDRSPIASATLVLKPVDYRDRFIGQYGMRPEDYYLVFPNDTRVIQLTPVDGEFDEKQEEFVAPIQNITGGVEYRIIALVKDSAGNERAVEIKTPYIRQFENFGRKLYEKGIIVGASYMPWDFKSTPMKDNYIPLLGRYDTLDDIVQWKHIDWAGYAGINVFFIDGEYVFSAGTDRYNVPTKFLEKGMKVGIFFGPTWSYKRGTNPNFPEWAVDLNDHHNFNKFISDFVRIGDWSLHPNYIKISGRPVVFIYESGAFFNESKAFRRAIREFEMRTAEKPFILADEIPEIPYTPTDIGYVFPFKDFSVIDGLTGWAGLHNREKSEWITNYEKFYDRQLNIWKKFADEKKLFFVPTLIPGYDDSYSWGPSLPPIKRSPQLFEERLKIAIRYTSNNQIKMIRIDTWNDFGEWTFIEPSVHEGFAYLNVLRNFLEENFSEKE